jgi:hypothetical protein
MCAEHCPVFQALSDPTFLRAAELSEYAGTQPALHAGQELQKISGSLADICGLRSFLALHNLELHRVAFLQALVAFAGDGAVVNEHIGSIVPSNEPISFGIIEPLHSSFQSIHVLLLEAAGPSSPLASNDCHFASASAQSQEM